MNIGSVRCLILPVTEIVSKALVILFGCLEGKEKIIETSYVHRILTVMYVERVQKRKMTLAFLHFENNACLSRNQARIIFYHSKLPQKQSTDSKDAFRYLSCLI